MNSSAVRESLIGKTAPRESNTEEGRDSGSIVTAGILAAKADGSRIRESLVLTGRKRRSRTCLCRFCSSCQAAARLLGCSAAGPGPAARLRLMPRLPRHERCCETTTAPARHVRMPALASVRMTRLASWMADDDVTGVGLLQESLRELSDALKRAVGASRPIEHRLLKGEFRERRVIAGLRPLVPARFSMTSGVVVNSTQEFSRQQDIVFSDTLRAAPFLAAGDLGVHPIELVDGVIEVKSAATGESVAEAVENIASVKRLAPYEMRDFTRVVASGTEMGRTNEKPFGGALFLGTSAKLETLFDAFLGACKDLDPVDRPHVMTIVGSATVQWVRADAVGGTLLSVEPLPTAANAAALMPVGGNALLSFYMTLMRVLGAYSPPPFDLASYVNSAGGIGAHEMTIQPL